MMVHSYDDTSLLLVLQIDHSRVAGLLAAHWGNAEFAEPKPYASFMLAAQERPAGHHHLLAARPLAGSPRAERVGTLIVGRQ